MRAPTSWPSRLARQRGGLAFTPPSNRLDPVDGFLRNATHLVHDRDPLFTKAWAERLKSGGVKSVPIPASSPNCNPFAERLVRTIRTGCLDHFVIFVEGHLRHLVREFVTLHNAERYHQGLGGQLVCLPASAENETPTYDPIRCRSRLGGVLNFYHRQAARGGAMSSRTLRGGLASRFGQCCCPLVAP